MFGKQVTSSIFSNPIDLKNDKKFSKRRALAAMLPSSRTSARSLWFEAMESRTHLSATVSGKIWYDLNADGVRQDSEPAGFVTSMELFNLLADNQWHGPAYDPINLPDEDVQVAINQGVQGQTMGVSGQYSFTIDVPEPGVYGVHAWIPYNGVTYVPTIAGQGADSSRDSDFPTKSTFSTPFVIRDGDQIVMDLGLVPLYPTTPVVDQLSVEKETDANGFEYMSLKVSTRDVLGDVARQISGVKMSKFDSVTGQYGTPTPVTGNTVGSNSFYGMFLNLPDGGTHLRVFEGNFPKGKYRIEVSLLETATKLYAEYTDTDEVPTVGELFAVPQSDGKIVLTAKNIFDIDNRTISSLQFWADADGSGDFDPAVDQLLQSTGSFQFTLSPSPTKYSVTVDPAVLASSSRRFFVRAIDQSSRSSPVVTADLSASNEVPLFLLPPHFDRVSYTPGSSGTLYLMNEYNGDKGTDDTDGIVTSAEAFWDSNGNGQFDPGTDPAIPGASASGYFSDGRYFGVGSLYVPLNFPLGTQTLFVRIHDNAGGTNTASVQVDIAKISGRDFWTYGPASVDSGSLLFLSTDVGDYTYGGATASIVYYYDANDNGLLDLGTNGDPVVGSKTNVTGYDFTQINTKNWTTGTHLLFARATDNQGYYQNLLPLPIVVNATANVGNLDISASIPTAQARSAPRLARSSSVAAASTSTVQKPLNIEPEPDLPFVLRALNVDDPDGAVKRVQFYLDVNKNGKVDNTTDRFVGLDDEGSDGWSVTIASAKALLLGIGSYQFIARAEDDQGAWGVPTVNTVNIYWKPKIESLTPNAPVIAKGATLKLTANNVTNPNSNVAGAEFWRDVDNNGIFDSAVDSKLASDISASDGYFANIATTSYSGAMRFFARAKDSAGRWGDAVSTVVIIDAAPTLTALTSSNAGSVQAGGFTLTATGAADADGVVSRVEFYLDVDKNSLVNPAIDVLLGTDTDGSNGWSLVTDLAPLNLPIGSQTFLARAIDDLNLPGNPKSVAVVLTTAPTIESLTAPATIVKGSSFTLVANNALDADGTVASVEFWRDTDGDLAFDPLKDLKLASDTTASDGWKTSVTTTSLLAGNYTFFARAKDNRNVLGSAVSTMVSVLTPVTLATPTLTAQPGTAVPVGTTLTLTAGNTTGAVAVEFYLDANNNGKLELTGTAPDVKLFTDTDGADDFTTTLDLPTSGARRFFARSIASTGQGFTSKVLLVNVSQPPTIASLSVPERVTKGKTALIQAIGAVDVDGTVTAVQFYRDVNNNGVIDAGIDSLTVTDTSASDGWKASVSTTSLALGPVTYLVRAKDNLGIYGPAVAVTFVIDATPTLPSFTASPTTVTQGSGQSVTLTAVASDVDTANPAVEFWRDGNGNGVIDATPGLDELLAIDADNSDGWTATIAAEALPTGAVTLLARAVDQAGGTSATKKLTVTVKPDPLASAMLTIVTI